uniref:NB-ARC domain-containing protein n=1 Tax=Oryza glumipatula TaxID=40148 RepID=A0A0E0BL42_9ORYZ
MNPEFDVDVCIKLIRKCGGLPKVIVAIARLLVTSKTNTSQLVQSMNTRFMGMLKTKPEVDDLRDLIGWTHYYLFQTCPVYLRPCILYLSSIFPGHCGVRRRRLVMRWVAEGYSKDTDSHTAEDNGEKFFSELVELDMVQHPPKSITTVFNETRMVLCQVNTFFQEYIISQPLEDNDFTLALEAFTLKGQCRPTTQRRGRHLVIEESWERDKIVFDSIDFSWLRSMTVFGNWEPYFVSEKMRLLRVLDLEEVSGLKDDDLERMMRLLCRLKFLSLRGCTNICHLPRSCGALRQLQTLDIRHTSIVTLPSTITKLPKLQYLRAGMAGSQWTLSNTNVLLNCSGRHQIAASVKVPAGIKQLTTLHTLGVLNASATGGKAILGELKELTQLRKLGVFGINRRNNNEFISAIASLRYLESLSVWFSEDNEQAGRLDGLSHPPKKLQSLKLYYNHVDRLPIWIDQLGNLRKLDLEMIMPTQEDIHLLGDLKFCIILRLCVNPSQDGEELHFSVRPEDTENNRPKGLGFPSLEVLEIACNSRLSLVMFEPRVMRLLEPLKVRCYGGQPSLVGLSILSCKRRRVCCEVNSFCHEYIMSQQMEDNHIFSLEGRCSLTSQRTGRHLVVGSTWERDKIVFTSIDFSRLRSLTVYGKWESFFISDNMKLLRVLDLENASDVTNDDLERVVSLPRLKFLSLRGCKMVSRLPDSLGGLRQLQTLDIRHTSVVRLPTAIVKLHKLQYIRGGAKVTLGEEGTSASLATAETETQPKCRSTHALLSWLPDLCRGKHAGDPCSGIEVPRGIEELTALHTLGVVNVGVAGGKAFLKELKNLTQLRKLGVSGINWKNIQELCSALSCHRYLESLSVRLDKDEQGSCDDKLKEDLRNRIAEHPNKLVLKLKME